MIEVRELTKIYKSRKSGKCVALDGVSFDLPNKGFIFIVGKSGSGKTTLLSLLGGLDTITSGEISENGRKFSEMSAADQVDYRSSTVGFIFQDFHLIDELTIYENIMLALQLNGEEDRDKALKALADTDLAEYENRYPKELSGGQKQRVAIARALVKEPSIILADEPTGNLDSKTTVQILDLLKALSKEKLVVIVSHDLGGAERYADEIIELSEGKILRHVKRNEAFDGRLRVENDTLVIPYGEKFSEENLREAVKELENVSIAAISQDGDRFVPYENATPIAAADPAPLKQKHLGGKTTAKLAVKFARKGWIRSVVYAAIFAIVLTVLGLSQSLMSFDGGKVLANEMSKRNMSCASFLKSENADYESVDSSRFVDVNDGDMQKFYDAGYEGNIYPLLNYPICNAMRVPSFTQRKPRFGYSPYSVSETGGLLITDEEFLKSKFGKLEFVAEADEKRDDGVYITDYLADSAIVNRQSYGLTYEDILREITWTTAQSFGYVNGIIYTGYKERYKEMLDALSDPTLSKDDMKELAKGEEYLAMLDELTQYLNIAYTFNKDFVNSAIELKDRQAIGGARSVFELNGQTYEASDLYFSDEIVVHEKRALKDDEMIMHFSAYNAIFGTSYSAQNFREFTPQTVTLRYFLTCDEARSVLKYEKEVKIVRLCEVGPGQCYVSNELFENLQRAELFTMGFYFDNVEQMDVIANVAEENGFLPNSSIATAITAMTKVVEVFSRFFDLVFAALGIMLFLLIVQYELKNIKDRLKDIGILKALGTRDRDLMLIFGFQVAAVGIGMATLYIAGAFAFAEIANRILAISLSELAKNVIVSNLSFLSVNWAYTAANCALAFAIFAVSFVVPMLRLRYIKPTDVIKSKE